MKTIILDNYDSFTYNLFQYVAELGGNPEVYRNDELTLKQLLAKKPSSIIISPGPGTPEKEEDFGICSKVITELGKKIPILGVCLGHQGLGYVYGGKIVHAPSIMHGKTSKVELDTSSKLFKGLPQIIEVMRYHSLIIDQSTLPNVLKVTAKEPKEAVIMAVEHISLPSFGIQFHPESIGTPHGMSILKNFLKIKF